MNSNGMETCIILWRGVELAIICRDGRWRPDFRKELINPSRPTGFNVLPNSENLQLPEGAETVSFITCFVFEMGKISGVIGNSRHEADMIRFLNHIDAKMPKGVMIELMNETGQNRLGPAVYKHLFARMGRFSLVQNRQYGSLLRTTMNAVSLHIDDLEANTREELIQKLFEVVKAFKIEERIARAG